jgi:hypothetical protein
MGPISIMWNTWMEGGRAMTNNNTYKSKAIPVTGLGGL